MRSKKHRYWTPLNAVLLPTFLTEAAIIHWESDAGNLLKIFARSIIEWAKEGGFISEADDDNNEDSVITIEAEYKKTVKVVEAKQATTETLTTITDNCNDVFASSRPPHSNLHKSLQLHSPCARTSVHASGSVVG